jgi:hypothetical protein
MEKPEIQEVQEETPRKEYQTPQLEQSLQWVSIVGASI